MHNSIGIGSIPSPYPVEITITKLKAVIEGKGLTLFAHIDHSAGATQAGLHMQPSHVLIFGNAKAGTPLMVANPLIALELPLKVLVWQDAEEKVWVSYNTPDYLIKRHDLSLELSKNIAGVEGLIKAALT
jgi:uncharacterized protein (DUF302 family)